MNAPGAFPSDESDIKHHSDHNKLTKEPPEHIRQDKKEDVEKGALHHTGHSHHDPEPETKQATSNAGNYPYWGNLPREGGQYVYRSDRPDSDPTKPRHGLSKDSSLATGASTAGASVIGAGYLGSDNSKDQETSRRDEITPADSTDDPKFDHASKGAAAAGLAGATYVTARDKDDSDKSEKKPTSKDSSAPTHASTHANKNKTVEETKTSTTTQKPAEAATPTKTASAGDNNTHRKEEEALAAGVGAAGLAGAGCLASNRQEERKDELPGSTRETSSGIAAPGSLAQRDTTSRQIEPKTGGGIHNTVVGVGSSEYSPPVGSSNNIGASHQTQTPSQSSQPVAQAAAKQAWNKQQPDSSNLNGDMCSDNKHSDLKYAAAGTAFGSGAAGIAANYGQGKDHEENPRTDQAEKVAERALGPDGKPHAPSATEGSGGTDKSASSGLTSGATGLPGQSGSTGDGAKVLHKCERCGHDNDISRYFDKDAVFRSQQ